jgi:hypothetical protein
MLVTNPSDRNALVGDGLAGICNALFRGPFESPLHLDDARRFILQQTQENSRLETNRRVAFASTVGHQDAAGNAVHERR